ncbi:hypothetical protein AgCh_026665 [Apium graveolens]
MSCFLVWYWVYVKAHVLRFVGTENDGGNESSENVSEVGWFILSEDQQHFGLMLFPSCLESESTIKISEYDVEKMTFEKEEELFPTVDDDIGQENVTVSSDVAVPAAKWKSPENPADKKKPNKPPDGGRSIFQVRHHKRGT